jgi:hypothetical protein
MILKPIIIIPIYRSLMLLRISGIDIYGEALLMDFYLILENPEKKTDPSWIILVWTVIALVQLRFVHFYLMSFSSTATSRPTIISQECGIITVYFQTASS